MRTVTAGETTTLGLASKRVTIRVKVANGSGTMIDYSTWVEAVSIDQDVDQPVSGATVTLTRAAGTQSLSPLRTDSTVNRLDDGVTYSPAVDLNRAITIEVATTASGAAIVAADYKLLFKGTVDVVNFEKTPVSIECRDLGAPLVDRWIETETNFGSGAGTAMETVMQNILDNVFGAAVYSLYTPVSPGFNIITYNQQKMSVMDALQDLVQLIGWDVRFKWDNGTSTFRLTLSAPDRTKTVPDYTFAPSTYIDISRLNLDLTNIRNVVTVSYRNSADLGNRATVTSSDAPSITKYGRRFFFIQEADVSPIDTSAEATTMADAARNDLKDPKADQEVGMPFFWPADLGDLYRYSDNDVHYDTNQDLAVVELKHEISANHHRTKVRVRGSPIGQYMTWLGRGGTIGGGGGTAFPPRPYIAPLNTETDNTDWDLRFNAVLGSGGGGTNLTYTVKTKTAFGSEVLESSGNASVFPLDLTIVRGLKEDKLLTFSVTDAATGMTAQAQMTIPAYVVAITASGTVMGSQIDAGTVGPTQTTGRSRSKSYRTTNQSLTSGVVADIAWEAEFYDVGNIAGAASIVIPAGGDTGTWLFVGQISFASNATGYRAASISEAGVLASITRVPAVSGDSTVVPVTHFSSAPAVGRVFTLAGFQNSGGALNVELGVEKTFFAAIHLW